MFTTHSNVSTNTKKAGLVVLAHGKMLNDEKKVTIVSAYDASLSCEMILENLKDEKVSAMITLSEETRRMQDMMKMYRMEGMGNDMFAGGEKLVLNANHPLVKYVVENKDNANVSLICKQLYDLAMLAHKPLSPEEMTAFIQRSNEIMMLLAK